jgi:threonine synthase
MNKYQLKCRACGHVLADMKQWFDNEQKCDACGHKFVDVEYRQDAQNVKQIIAESKAQSLFDYFDFLPLNQRENIVSSGEGVIPVEHWSFLDQFALNQYGINCKVHVYRNDLSPGTGTFKDVAASLAASVLKENGIKQFAIASTGNIATAFAYYLAKAGISLAVFIPQDALMSNEAEISAYGQKVFRVEGDYAYAKKIAAEYANKNKILISGGNIDPMRVEAKKTMVFEWIRQMESFPTVYIQALSGGTGPIAIDKALNDLKNTNFLPAYPRYIMVQPSACNPMTLGWERAKELGFPDGWKNDYPIIDSPVTKVPTLATGNPATYPIIADLVHKSKGEMLTFDESKIVDVARLIAFEKQVRIGPASTIAMGGFFEALKFGHIKNGDVVLINLGEGVRRAPELMEEMVYTTERVSSVEQCRVPEMQLYKDQLWRKVL